MRSLKTDKAEIGMGSPGVEDGVCNFINMLVIEDLCEKITLD